MNKFSKQKENISVLFSIVNIVLFLFLFIINMTVFYKLNEQGVIKNIIINCLYLIILIVFGTMCEIFELGNTTVKELFMSYSLDLFITNFLIYFSSCLVFLKMINVLPFIVLQILDMLLAAIILLKENKCIRDNYPIQKALAICGDYDKTIIDKIYAHRDILVTIDRTVQVNDINFENCDELLKGYNSIVTLGIDYKYKKKLFDICYEKRIKIFDIPTMIDMFIASSSIVHVIDTPILKLNKFGPSMLERIVKRFIDIFGSLLLIVITSPIMLFIAIAIKVNDGGTIFYKQKRLTRDNKEFNILKFRSMIMNAELSTGVVLAREDDTRITKIGKLIRKTRLDELPQLFNILKGDMTFVGPRPERPEIYERVKNTLPEFKYRLVVKSGLTGYAQIYGKYNTSLKDKLFLDMYYIENYRLMNDIKLMILTIKMIFKPESTEGIK